MIIAGLQSLSLVDYPGHLATVVFVQGCNFQCGYCHNPDLITLDKLFCFSEQHFFDFVEHRRKMIEGVVITGGEPTIYEALPDFIRRIKEKELKVKLDTNGANPAQIDNLLRLRLLDYIAVDIKTSIEKYHLLTKTENIKEIIKETIYWIKLCTIPYEFRTTCVPGIVDEEAVRAIGEVVRGAKKYCFQQFNPRSTYDKEFQKVKPYCPEKLNEFKKILEEFVEEVDIRGV